MKPGGYTTVLHDVRRLLDLSLTEYCLLDLLYRLSTNPKAPIEGWCNASKETLGDMLGVSSKTVTRHLVSLQKRNFIEKEDNGRLLKTTDKWSDPIIQNNNTDKMSRTRTKCPTGRDKVSHETGTKCPTTIIITDIIQERIGKKQAELLSEVQIELSNEKVDELLKFLEYRIEIKKPYQSQSAIKALCQEIADHALEDVREGVHSSMAGQYQKLVIRKPNGKQAPPHTPPQPHKPEVFKFHDKRTQA